MTMTAEIQISQASHADTPFGEMWRVAELNPDFSLLQVIESIDRDLWDIEAPNADQRLVYARVNGQKALIALRKSIDGLQAEYSLDAPARRRQWLASGMYLHLHALLQPSEITQWVAQCDRLLTTPGTRPIRLFEQTDIVPQSALRRIANATLAALPTPFPALANPAILKQRTLLRRTFPPSQLPQAHGNANNQYWHQDSNPKFNDAPMLTLWIPLQNGAGVNCPGLEIIDAPVSYFSILHGDSSQSIDGILRQMFPETKVIPLAANAGDCLVFNGLTFHQTLTTPAMESHRDALLIRIIDAADADAFGTNGAIDGIVPLG